MMVEDVERTPMRQKRRRRKTLYFTYDKERFRLNVGKKKARREGKKYNFEYDNRNCEDTGF